MCFLPGCIRWSFSCLQRSLTFVLGFWVVLMILYALALAIGAGIAFGYDYCFAEYTTLARNDTKFMLKIREYTPDKLARRIGGGPSESGIMADDDQFYVPDKIHNPETLFPGILPNWIYKSTVKQMDQDSKLTRATRRLLTRTTTAKTKKMHKQSRTSMKVTSVTTGEDASNRVTETSKARTVLDLRTVTSPPVPTRTRIESTSSKPTQKRKFPKSTAYRRILTPKRTTLPQSRMREFNPESTLSKWLPTKPDINFFYKTSSPAKSVNFHRNKMKEEAYYKDMELRIPEGYKGLPMRHWYQSTPITEPDTTFEENYWSMLYF